MNKQIFRMLLVLFFVVVCVSAGVIYFTFDRRALDYLTTFRPQYALLALFLLGVGLFFDGTRLITLTHLSDEKMDYKHVFNVVFSNYFLALLTPGQGGGGIAQLMFMKKAGVSVAKSTLIIIVRTVMSILFLFLTVPVVFYFDPSLVSWMPPSVIALVCAFFIFAPGMLIYPKQVLRAFIESGLSLLFIYSVVPVFIYAFGITNIPLHIIMGRMCLINLVLYFTPTPGGTGVAEGGFLVLFNSLLPAGVAGVVAVMWRFFCEYIPFTIGAIVTIKSFGLDVLTQIRRRNID